MATKPSSSAITFDTSKFENIHQVGGIRTGTLDSHPLGGLGGRVALVDTGAGLRFTVALDRGGDIVDARFNQHALAYLTPNGLVPPNHAHQTGIEWIYGWAGGLVTTCGPQYMGGPREEDGVKTSLHGHYSNVPAAVEQLINPDPHRGRLDMQISLVTRDSRMFGPVMEVRRTIRCTLGEPEIIIEDEVTNRANTCSAHHWLYHCNLGYPLLDKGARFIYRGKAKYWVVPPPAGQDIIQPMDSVRMNRLKRAPEPLPGHAGFGERGLIVDVTPDKCGICRVGLLNERLKLAVEITYPAKALPRLANWQHYGPRGSYVTGLEPFFGSLLGKARDKDPRAEQYLQPGESRRYALKLRVLSDRAALRELAAFDGPLTT
ncbi:MAG: DUF4432 family protein [Verrucomicrobia bacterium]|nr:DUF4432 family protein [Verrucomicrobiota bacterium]